jgi:hypothetical protein
LSGACGEGDCPIRQAESKMALGKIERKFDFFKKI